MGPPAWRSPYHVFFERLKDNPISNEEELGTAKRARAHLDKVRFNLRKSENPEDAPKVEQANIATNLVRQRIAEYESAKVKAKAKAKAKA